MVKTLLKKNKIKNGVLKNGLRYVLNDNDTFSKKCKGIIFSFPLLVTPIESQNSLMASGVYPLLLKPSNVNILGSSQPFT